MLTLPIPMIVALTLGFFFLRVSLAEERPVVFLALLLSCAIQSLVISLCQHYGFTALLPLQPITATTVPPLAWLAFQTAALRPLSPARDWLHLAAPAFTVFCMIFAPVTLDIVVSGIFLIYGGAILYRLSQSLDELPLVRLEAGRLPAQIWAAIGAALILSAATDGLIALALARGQTWAPPLIISIFSSLALLSIGILSLSPNAAAGAGEEVDASERDAAEVTEEDTSLIARLDGLLETAQLYLDSSLTVSRLARRLHVPIKLLSSTVNRASGQNISRYINDRRIRHACDELHNGASVTAAMLSSGFNTKSNFNREFKRVTQMSPSEWREQLQLAD